MKQLKRSFILVICALALSLTLNGMTVRAAVELKALESAQEGEDFTVTVITTEELTEVQFSFYAEGMEFIYNEDPNKTGTVFHADVYDGEGIAVATAAGRDDEKYAAGETLGTLVFEVTAAKGETVTLTIRGMDEWAGMADDTLTLTVGEPVPSSDGASGGAPVGLIIGIIAGVLVIAGALVAVILIIRKKKQTPGV